MSEDLNDILYDIDMQLYDEFNDKIATMNDYLGDVYSFRDIEEVEKAKKEKEIQLLRIAIIKQQKKIEELKKNNETQPDCVEPVEKTEEMVNMRWVNHRFISKDKLKEILGIEETDSEKILSLLQTVVDENARLEDIEDKKVQIEYNNVFNKGVKSVEDKIKAKIEFIKSLKEKIYYEENVITILQSLLEKE